MNLTLIFFVLPYMWVVVNICHVYILNFPVAATPTLVSLNQISLTAVTVDWRDPSEGVLGGSGVFIIHYSDGITNRNKKVAAFPS